MKVRIDYEDLKDILMFLAGASAIAFGVFIGMAIDVVTYIVSK